MTTTKPNKLICKCGKPMPIAPEYCKDCGQGYLGNKKLVVVGVSKCIQAEPDQSKKSIQDYVSLLDLQGKITEKHAEEINEIISNLLSQQRKEIIDETVKIVENAKLPYPNPCGKFVKVERVNGVILGRIINKLQSLKKNL